MRRPCLGCGVPISSGSRCPLCAAKRRNKVLPEMVKARDGHVCRECGRADRPLEAHHIVPLELGGKDTGANMITLCDLCHLRKRSKRNANAA